MEQLWAIMQKRSSHFKRIGTFYNMRCFGHMTCPKNNDNLKEEMRKAQFSFEDGRESERTSNEFIDVHVH